MNGRFKKNMLALGAFLCLAACAGAGTPVPADLQHHRFVLESVDGNPFVSVTGAPDIEFNQDLRVSGRICNRYAGQAVLENGILTVSRMASTKMLCPDPDLNSLESLFISMLMAGAQVELSGNTLTLRQGGHVLVYRLHDWVR